MWVRVPPGNPPEERKPCCAFLDTYNDRFLENDVGAQMFDSPEEVAALGTYAERCAGLIPKGFWEPKEPMAGVPSTPEQRAALSRRLAELLRPLPESHSISVAINAAILMCEEQGLDPRTILMRSAAHYDD